MGATGRRAERSVDATASERATARAATGRVTARCRAAGFAVQRASSVCAAVFTRAATSGRRTARAVFALVIGAGPRHGCPPGAGKISGFCTGGMCGGCGALTTARW